MRQILGQMWRRCIGVLKVLVVVAVVVQGVCLVEMQRTIDHLVTHRVSDYRFQHFKDDTVNEFARLRQELDEKTEELTQHHVKTAAGLNMLEDDTSKKLSKVATQLRNAAAVLQNLPPQEQASR